MSKRQFRLPSPALVLATIALALGLGGSAFAATTLSHSDAKAVTKLVKKLAPSLSVKNANTVGGKKIKQFFVSQAPNTGTATVASVDGITLKASCSSLVDPTLTIENDSGQGGMIGGYSSATNGNVNDIEFGSTPVSLSGANNGGGSVTVELRNRVTVSLQWADTGTLGGSVTDCYDSGTLIAS